MESEILVPIESYTPERLPRRGEIVAWSLCAFALAAWLVLSRFGQPISIVFRLFAIFIFLSALAISLGNWMDRQTRLILDKMGISFENGLRKVHLNWREIRLVEVIPSSWGNKVRVQAETGHFDFRTLGEVRQNGVVKGRMGFSEGELILNKILLNAGLKENKSPGNNRYYSTTK